MKNTLATAFVIAASASFATAGDFITPPETSTPPIETAEGKKVTGTLSLDAYSHFVSYGNDVWGDASDANDFAFNPLLELSFDLGGGWSASLGTWWDVNDSKPSNNDFGNANSLGGNIQEIDVWVGVGYETGIYSASLTYQQWFYGGDTEEILDLSLGLDVFLSPSILIHQRLAAGAAGAAGGGQGTVIVFGLEYGFETGPVSWSVPLKAAYFPTDGYHGEDADDGFGYASIGLNGSVPLPFLNNALGGDWSFNAGLTYYATNDDVAVNNDDDRFVVSNFGVALSF